MSKRAIYLLYTLTDNKKLSKDQRCQKSGNWAGKFDNWRFDYASTRCETSDLDDVIVGGLFSHWRFILKKEPAGEKSGFFPSSHCSTRHPRSESTPTAWSLDWMLIFCCWWLEDEEMVFLLLAEEKQYFVNLSQTDRNAPIHCLAQEHSLQVTESHRSSVHIIFTGTVVMLVCSHILIRCCSDCWLQPLYINKHEQEALTEQCCENYFWLEVIHKKKFKLVSVKSFFLMCV